LSVQCTVLQPPGRIEVCLTTGNATNKHPEKRNVVFFATLQPVDAVAGVMQRILKGMGKQALAIACNLLAEWGVRLTIKYKSCQRCWAWHHPAMDRPPVSWLHITYYIMWVSALHSLIEAGVICDSGTPRAMQQLWSVRHAIGGAALLHLRSVHHAAGGPTLSGLKICVDEVCGPHASHVSFHLANHVFVCLLQHS
jgi:hypothetical protein